MTRVEAALSSSTLPLPKFFASLGSSASGGSVRHGDVELRCLHCYTPEPKLLIVHKVLSISLAHATSEAKKAEETLEAIEQAKKAARARGDLARGVALPRAKVAKQQARATLAARTEIEEILKVRLRPLACPAHSRYRRAGISTRHARVLGGM